MSNSFKNLQYNEITAIKELVEKELIRLFSLQKREVSLIDWYLENKSKLEAVITWQVALSRDMILGSIYHRCLKHEEECRNALTGA